MLARKPIGPGNSRQRAFRHNALSMAQAAMSSWMFKMPPQTQCIGTGNVTMGYTKICYILQTTAMPHLHVVRIEICRAKCITHCVTVVSQGEFCLRAVGIKQRVELRVACSLSQAFPIVVNSLPQIKFLPDSQSLLERVVALLLQAQAAAIKPSETGRKMTPTMVERPGQVWAREGLYSKCWQQPFHHGMHSGRVM